MQLEVQHLDVVRGILATHLTGRVRVFAFGSRATGKARRASDFDLLLDAGQPLPADTIASLREAFDESVLPWKVDLVDRATISPAFAQAIAASLIPI